MTDHQPMPVKGYTPQSQERLDQVNMNKLSEELSLKRLDELELIDGIDKRWLAIGRTHIEQGWMAINRAVFRPERAK